MRSRYSDRENPLPRLLRQLARTPVHDLEVKHIIDYPQGQAPAHISFEASNPRHEHEWRCGRRPNCRTALCLSPASSANSSVLVEHPELVAQRLMRYADFVGRENVIAGTDCGFARASPTSPRQHRLGEDEGDGAGRAARHQATLELTY